MVSSRKLNMKQAAQCRPQISTPTTALSQFVLAGTACDKPSAMLDELEPRLKFCPIGFQFMPAIWVVWVGTWVE